jgi:zinc transport system substrate-binding protein
MTAASRKIAAQLEALDPAHAAEYRRNLAGFLEDAGRLDREIRTWLSMPGTSRAFVVYHPSWGYFAERYGLEQIAIEAEGKEPGAAGLIQLIDRARHERARVVLVPEGFPRESAQVIADAIHGRIVSADPLAPDWEATLLRVAEVLANG